MPINHQEILREKMEPRQPRYAESLLGEIAALTLTMHPDTRFGILALAASPKSGGRRPSDFPSMTDQEKEDLALWQEELAKLRANGRITDDAGKYLRYEDKGADLAQRVVAFLSRNSRTIGSPNFDPDMQTQDFRDRKQGVNSHSLTIGEFRKLQEEVSSMDDLKTRFSGPSNQIYLVEYGVLFFPPSAAKQ